MDIIDFNKNIKMITAVKRSEKLREDHYTLNDITGRTIFHFWIDDDILYYNSENKKVKMPFCCDFLFGTCSELVDIEDLKYWDMSNVNSMNCLFSGCVSLSNLHGIEDWDLSNLKKMTGCFLGCDSLADLSPLKNWDTSNLDDLQCVFSHCSHLKDVSPIKDWNVLNVNRFNCLFTGCSKEIDIKPLKNWNVSIEARKLELFAENVVIESIVMTPPKTKARQRKRYNYKLNLYSLDNYNEFNDKSNDDDDEDDNF